MAIIAIVSYFVMKNQRRYYRLQEEYSVNTDQRELNRKTKDVNNINGNNFNPKNQKINIYFKVGNF